MIARKGNTRPLMGAIEFTPTTIETCLRVLALCGGNSHEAERQLKSSGTLERVPTASAMRDWRCYDHRDRYLELAADLGPEIERTAVALTRENMTRLAARVNEGINSIDFEAMNAGDIPKAVQQLSVAQGIQQDKLMTLTDRPDRITQHRDSETDWNALAKRLGVIDSTATEIPNTALTTDSDDSNPRELAA